MSRVLPVGVSERAFETALAEFVTAVGADHVHVGDELADEFQDPYGVRDDNPYQASAVVQPDGVAEIQAVLDVARRHGIPVWTNSQGRNNGYGGGAPRVTGSVVVNLRRMNRILEVHEALGYAVIEPGVSYFQLYEHLRENSIPLWVDVPDLGWGSIIGNALDHGYGYTPYGDHAAALCGLEVVLADGDVVRTGMGGLPEAPTWHTHKRGFGPSMDALFMQSNFGVVTKAGIWLLPQPQAWRACWVMIEDEGEIGTLIDALRPLFVSGVINHRVSVSNVLNRATPVSKRSDWWTGEGPIPDDVMKRIGEKIGWKSWNARIGFWGSDAVVDAQYAELERAIADVPGVTLITRKYRGDTPRDQINPSDYLLAGVPNMNVIKLLGWLGSDTGGHIGFTPIAPLNGADADRMIELVKRHTRARGLDFGAAFALQQRSMYLIALILFDYANPEEVAAAWELTAELVQEASDLGYGEYRSHLNFMDLVGDQYSFNDHAQRRLAERIKDALDPEGILSPGKQGIWPASYRGPE